jgi:hypothetical protein
MKRISLLLALTAAPASAGFGNNSPHRDWGHTITLDMTLNDAAACIAREMSRHGRVLILPVEGGNDIDFHANAGFATSTEAWETFKLREEGGSVTLRALYRHPFTSTRVDSDVARLGNRCLISAQMGHSSGQ